jgi:hypothetical protein
MLCISNPEDLDLKLHCCENLKSHIQKQMSCYKHTSLTFLFQDIKKNVISECCV